MLWSQKHSQHSKENFTKIVGLRKAAASIDRLPNALYLFKGFEEVSFLYNSIFIFTPELGFNYNSNSNMLM